jgi:hypothetical protein
VVSGPVAVNRPDRVLAFHAAEAQLLWEAPVSRRHQVDGTHERSRSVNRARTFIVLTEQRFDPVTQALPLHHRIDFGLLDIHFYGYCRVDGPATRTD